MTQTAARTNPDIYAYTGTAQDSFSEDLVAALAELHNPLADQRADVPTKAGGRFSYRYAALPDILDQVRPVLARHHLALLQSVVQEAPGTIGVITRLQHSSGRYQDFGPLVLPAAGDAQSVGGAITYARRYALCTVLGIAADEDSDGKSSGESTATQTVRSSLQAGGRAEAGTNPERTAGPASPATSEPTVAEPPLVAEGSGSEPGGPVELRRSGEKAGSPGSQTSEGGEPGLTGGAGSPPSHEEALAEALKLVGNRSSKLRGYVNTFCGTRYTTQTFDEVTTTQLALTIAKLRELIETGTTTKGGP